MSDPEPAAPAPLPRRPPRPLVVHWLVDAGVIFLATVLVAWFVGLNIWVLAGVAIVLGALVAPLTRKAEARALAERPEP